MHVSIKSLIHSPMNLVMAGYESLNTVGIRLARDGCVHELLMEDFSATDMDNSREQGS